MKGEAHEVIHAALYGDAGSKKSTMAATFPLPHILCFFDGLGKDGPYKRRYKELGLKRGKAFSGQEDQRCAPYLDAEGKLQALIEYYDEPDPETPWACDAFRRRIRRFVTEGEAKATGTLIVDSASGLVDASSNQQQYSINMGDADHNSLAWMKGITNDIERFLVKGIPYFRCNCVVTFHVQIETVKMKVGKGPQPPAHFTEKGFAEFQDKEMRSLALPGRVRKTNAIFSRYSESYRLYAGEDGEVKVQTVPDGEYVACTQINAPNGCEPSYEALWSNQS